MKKIYLLFVAATLAACSAEPVENYDLNALDAAVAGKNKVASQAVVEENPMGFYTGQNNGRKLKGTLSILNDCDNFYLEIIPENEGPEDVSIWFYEELPELNGGENNVKADAHFSLNEATDLKWTFPLENFDTDKPILVFVKSWGSFTGAELVSEVAYSEFEFDLSMCGCEESFSYKDNENGTYTFTYVPAEDIDGAELTFTFPQDVVNAFPEPFSQNGNGNDTTFSANVNLEGCQTYNWTFGLSADCTGKGQTEANLWTDFKIGEDSKRDQFELEKIRKPCN